MISPGSATTGNEQLLVFAVVRALCILATGYVFALNFMNRTEGSRWRRTLGRLGWAVAIFLLTRPWLMLVSRLVPEPYLDEFFHVPQAQKYCEEKWLEWDDKITTPPGLYLLSMAFRSLGLAPQCSTADLRLHNGIAIAIVAVAATSCRNRLEPWAVRTNRKGITRFLVSSSYSVHTGINIALFPPLFFFSALYYTDIASTLMVLACCQDFLHRRHQYVLGKHSADLQIRSVIVGVAAIAMRQTNVFWVVVFLGGLEAVDAVAALPKRPVKVPHFVTLPQMLGHYVWRYSLGDIHDPSISFASPHDWVLSLVSIGVAVICNPFTVLKRVMSRITLLGLFAAFVVVNGGVVLGDKSNHVATIHLAQMLYIWPLFAFFSAPLFLSLAAQVISYASRILFPQAIPENMTWSSNAVRELSILLGVGTSQQVAQTQTASSPQQRQSHALKWTIRFFEKQQYSLPLLIVFHGLAFFIVRYNTLIHPFTLADNRHYMFYVFRYTILRRPWIRYALVPIYVLCARLCWSTLAGSCSFLDTNPEIRDCPRRHPVGIPLRFNSPFQPARVRSLINKSELAAPPRRVVEDDVRKAAAELGPTLFLSDSPTNTSTAMLWLLATALSLVTAPLVEPRYFILPWVFWRLLVPAWAPHSCRINLRFGPFSPPLWLVRFGQRFDLRLFLETTWFVVINVVTMYIFLFRPYQWKAADGSVMDGGNWQRFMW